MYTRAFIIGSEDRKRIKCSVIVHEKNVSFVPEKIFVCDYMLISLWNGVCKRLTDVMNETTFMLVSKKNCHLLWKKFF